MTGYDKAKETADKLKAEQAEEKAKQEENKEKAQSELALIGQNKELAKMYADNAKVGGANLQGELPLLKVHATGRSNKNFLSNGEEPNDGAFFYKPTADQYDGVEVHILTISRGFRAVGLEGKGNVFNQIVGGCIIEEGNNFKPFIMYMTGLKLSNLWEFGKLASKYTKARPIPIPMFALTIRLTTQKVANSYGKSWIIDFEIVKNEDGSPKLIMDPEVFNYLKDSVVTVEDTIASLVAAKENKEEEEEETPIPTQEVQTGEEVALDDIPF